MRHVFTTSLSLPYAFHLFTLSLFNITNVQFHLCENKPQSIHLKSLRGFSLSSMKSCIFQGSVFVLDCKAEKVTKRGLWT